jgi:hypothetical protein
VIRAAGGGYGVRINQRWIWMKEEWWISMRWIKFWMRRSTNFYFVMAYATEYDFWTGSDWKGPVHGCHCLVESGPIFPVDRTVLSSTADWVRLDWRKHWYEQQPRTIHGITNGHSATWTQRVTLDASLTCWLTLISQSRWPNARICTISHMRMRMLYLTWDASPWSWSISSYSHHLHTSLHSHTRHQTMLRLTIQVYMQHNGWWTSDILCVIVARYERTWFSKCFGYYCGWDLLHGDSIITA